MQFKLFALDVDGTLVTVRDEIPQRTLAALLELRASGVEIVICTGRRYSRALPVAQKLGLTLPVITASGALIKRPHDHATLFRADFAAGLIREMLAFFADRRHEPILYTDSFGRGYDFHLANELAASPELAEFLELNRESILVDRQLFAAPPDGVFAGFVMGQRPAMETLASELAERWPERLYLHVIRSPRYLGYMCEISPFGVNKWTGVERVARELGIRDEEICAAGDDVNDSPMLKAAGLGIAMGNAPEEVQAAADRVAPPLAEEGLLQVVEWIREANQAR